MPRARARSARRLLACLALLSAPAGCAGHDEPFDRAGTWRPEYLNDANIEAMLNDKRHLQQGVGDDASPAALSAAAIRRLLTDQVKPLPSTEIGPVAAPTQNGSGGGAGAGGGS